MTQSFEWMMAGRYLRARRAEGFISVIAGFSLMGIALGVATLIIVMSVMNGFRAELLGRILGINGHMAVQSNAGPLLDYEAAVRAAMTVQGVTAAFPMAEGQVLVSSKGNASGALLRGLRPPDLKLQHLLHDALAPEARTAFAATPDGLLIGVRMAQRFGVSVGDTLSLIAPQGTTTPFGVAPRIVAYPIVGIFTLGMSEYDANFVFVPMETAQRFLRLGEGVSVVEIMTDNPDTVARTAALITPMLPPATHITTWEQMNASFFGALQVERNVMFLILTLIIIVAAFNIISSLIMLVKDKGRDIAILRTMGATRGSVMRIFFIAGASIGVIGTTLGVILGVAFCANIEGIRQTLQKITGTTLFDPTIYFLSRMPAKMDPAEVVVVVVMALGLSFLATLYPSWRAARLDPVEALRRE